MQPITDPLKKEKHSHSHRDVLQRLYEERYPAHQPATLRILSERLEFLRNAIEKIQQQIEARQKLSEGFQQQLSEEISSFEVFLREVRDSWRMGYNPSLDARRTHLERKLADLRHELRLNHLNSWRDIL